MSDISLKSRIADAAKLSEIRSIPKFCGFLSAAEATEAEAVLSNKKHLFFGGYEGAERTVVGILPNWMEEETVEFPIIPLSFRYRRQYTLSHRDFLGSIMALGIKRSTVGDILIGEGLTVIFVLEEIAEYVVSQITKVGKVGVQIEIGAPSKLPEMSNFIEGQGTVASERLDCVVAELSKKSRQGANLLIESGYVTLNSKQAEKSTQAVKEGDILSIRSVGKFVIENFNERSKKGRLVLKWKKYN